MYKLISYLMFAVLALFIIVVDIINAQWLVAFVDLCMAIMIGTLLRMIVRDWEEDVDRNGVKENLL